MADFYKIRNSFIRGFRLYIVLILALLISVVFINMACAVDWWNDSYSNRIFINCTFAQDGLPISINGTSGFIIPGGTNKQIVWTNCQPNLFLYWNSQSDYKIATDTTAQPFEVEMGNSSSSSDFRQLWANYTTVLHFNDNSSKTVNDSSPVNAQFTIRNNTHLVDRFFGKAFYFDGGYSCLNSSQANSYKFAGDSVYEFFYNQSNSANSEHMLSTVPTGQGFQFRMDLEPTYQALWWDTTWRVLDAFVVTYGSEYQIANVKAGSKGYVYVNGISQGTPVTIGNVAGWGNLGIGCNADSNPTGTYFQGVMDEVRFSNRSMNASYYGNITKNWLNTVGYGMLFSTSEKGVVPFLNISIQSPQNRTYNYTYIPVNISLNFTILGNASKCWYNLNYGANNTISNCLNTSILLNASQNYKLNLYANNSDNNVSVANVSFYLNFLQPSLNISIQSPQNITYNFSYFPFNISLNYTIQGNASRCWYSLDYEANNSLSNCTNTTILLNASQNHILNVYANNSINNISVANVSFYLNFIPLFINISIQAPENRTYNYTYLAYNYSICNSTQANVSMWFHLNENSGSIVGDSSGNGRNGTAVNSPTWVTGKLNNALNFNGVNQYINLGQNGNFERTKNFTFETWFKTGGSASQVFISKILTTGSYTGWEVYFDGTSTNRLYFDEISTATSNMLRVYFTDSSIADNTWHHLIISYDGSSTASGVKFYYDGTLKTGTTEFNSLSASILTNNTLQISGRGAGTVLLYNGILDEIVIYDQVLTQSDVTMRYNGGAGREDYAGNQTCINYSSVPAYNLSINYTIQGNASQCWYNLNYGQNQSLPSCINTTTILNQSGNYFLNVYSNNSINDLSVANVSFYLAFVLPAAPTDINVYPIPQRIIQNTTIRINWSASYGINVSYNSSLYNFSPFLKLYDNSPINLTYYDFTASNLGNFTWGVYAFDMYSQKSATAYSNNFKVCAPSFSCSNLDICGMNNISKCLNVSDLGCDLEFTGNVSLYDSACVYVYPYVPDFLDLTKLQGGIFLFILVFFWFGSIALSFAYRNFALASIGWLTGALIGFFLIQWHIMIAVGFLMLDTLVFLSLGGKHR